MAFSLQKGGASSLRTGGTVFSFTPYIPSAGTGDTVKFRAFISSISDSYSPSWAEHMDMGRADPKFMYQSYSRTISVDFMTAALVAGEEMEWIKALNSLSEMTKPKYLPGKGFNGVYTKMVIGNLINEIGILSNVSYNINNESPWINDLPIYIECSAELKVIGDKKPDYKVSKGGLGSGEWGSGKQ